MYLNFLKNIQKKKTKPLFFTISFSFKTKFRWMKRYSSTYFPFLDFKLQHFLIHQRRSFQNFLKNGLMEEFEALKKITNSNNTIELIFFIQHYKLIPPKWTPKQAILKRKTYACELFIPVKLTNVNSAIRSW